MDNSYYTYEFGDQAGAAFERELVDLGLVLILVLTLGGLF